MEQFFVPHYKWVQGRLVPVGCQPVGQAGDPDGCHDGLSTIRLEKVKDQESGRLLDVFITKPAGTKRHINICIIERTDDPSH